MKDMIADDDTVEYETDDPVNHPAHYTHGAIEVIDAIEDWGLSYAEGNIIKYMARWRHKNGIEDLKKARWYLDRLITNQKRLVGK